MNVFYNFFYSLLILVWSFSLTFNKLFLTYLITQQLGKQICVGLFPFFHYLHQNNYYTFFGSKLLVWTFLNLLGSLFLHFQIKYFLNNYHYEILKFWIQIYSSAILKDILWRYFFWFNNGVLQRDSLSSTLSVHRQFISHYGF